MKQRSDQDQWNKEQIEIHLKSAVDTLTPDIFEKLDLSVPQENEEAVKERQETKKGRRYFVSEPDERRGSGSCGQSLSFDDRRRSLVLSV